MNATHLVLAIGIGLFVAWELYALLSKAIAKIPRVQTISETVWHLSVDKGVEGAPIIFLVGFLMGHFFWPAETTGVLRLLSLSLSVAFIVYEFIASFIKDMFTPSRMFYRAASRINTKFAPTGVFLAAYVVGHLIFPR